MKSLKTIWVLGAASAALGLAGGTAAYADDAPAAAAAAPAPAALSTPAMTGPLSNNPTPYGFDVGGSKIYVSGQLTGLGLWQNNAVPGDKSSQADISNAQIEIQKTDGVFQFYVQAGAYSLPSLGAAYIKASDLPDLTYHYVPNAFIKIAPNAAFSLQAGILPTLIGAEYTFTFQNMNVVRGLLWNQEPAVSRGVQANYTQGPWAVNVAWTDGYYSNRYTTGSTLITYTVGKEDTVAFAGSAQFSDTAKSSFATPLAQNNGDIFNLIWTHTEGAWQVVPYLQYGHTPKSTKAGLPASGSTFGAAVLGKYTFSPLFSLAARGEYISSSGSQPLLYGPKSDAWSFTVTPTWQFKTFFIRGEFAFAKVTNGTAGAMFGANGDKDSQTRALIETGVLF
jgi:hypothetical protein